MSQRSFDRANERRAAAERRRTSVKRRRAGLAGAAMGAATLLAPGVAQAANFQVDRTDDDGSAGACDSTIANDCSLRNAVDAASGNTEADTITFAPGLSGTIRLVQGQLVNTSADSLLIAGTGSDPGAITISGDATGDGKTTDDSRIISSTGAGALTVSTLTLSGGNPQSGDGGAIQATGAGGLVVTNSVVSGNTAPGAGGGISGTDVTVANSTVSDNDATGVGGGVAGTTSVTLTDASTVSDNATSFTNTTTVGAGSGGGGISAPSVDLAGGTISGNDAPNARGGGVAAGMIDANGATIDQNTAASGGGLLVGVNSSSPPASTLNQTTVSNNDATAGDGGGMVSLSPLTLTSSTITGNTATQRGGALARSGIATNGKYNSPGALSVSGSALTNNQSDTGGALSLRGTNSKYTGTTGIATTTVAGNTATSRGGGIDVETVVPGSGFTLSASTVSGNDVTNPTGSGGGIAFGDVGDTARLTDATVSGNVAGTGAGVAVTGTVGGQDAPSLENSTVTDNVASVRGGGIDAGPDVNTVELTSTAVANNTAANSPGDLGSGAAQAGFDASFSLIETPGSAPLTQDAGAPSIIGADPQLGTLRDNGGPTLTQLPADSSPLVDRGLAPARLNSDQRGLARTVDTRFTNATRGDGTDIGAVELASVAPAPVTPQPAQPAQPAAPAPTPSGSCEGKRATVVVQAGKPIVGTSGNDVIVGTSAADTIIAGGGNDLICAGGGNDRIAAGDGNDRVLAGAGNDSASGDRGSDVLLGDVGNDRLFGRDGNDTLSGQAGADGLDGGTGNDRLDGASGKDRLTGASGDDRLSGGSENDRLSAGSGDDRADGGSGNDRLLGGTGDDLLLGSTGNDRLAGDNGDDRLFGNAGDDVLSGGEGRDRLDGGSGNDKPKNPTVD